MIKTVKKGNKILYTDGTHTGRRVTSIPDALDKPALKFWTMKVALEYMSKQITALESVPDVVMMDKIVRDAKKAPFKESEQALDVGSTVHKLVEEQLRAEMSGGAEVDYKQFDKEVQNSFEMFLKWKDTVSLETLGLETKVMYRMETDELGVIAYGGTLDWYGYLDGCLTIIDWKTSKAIYEPSMPLQLSAYMLALEQELGKLVDGGCAIGRLGKQKAQFEFVQYSREQMKEYASAFKNLFMTVELLDAINEK